jgi:hypothetical protein
MRELAAGDGWLAQSSKWLHFGLGDATEIDRVVVRWPGGATQELPGPPVDARYQLEQGSEEFKPTPRRDVTFKTPSIETNPPPPTTRGLVLREPLPLPSSVRMAIGGSNATDGKPILAVLWSVDDERSVGALRDLLRDKARFDEAGIKLIALCIDAADRRESAEQRFADVATGLPNADGAPENRHASESVRTTLECAIKHLRDPVIDWPLPPSAGLLLDGAGSLNVFFPDPPVAETVLADHERFIAKVCPAALRCGSRGRWYFSVNRDFTALAAELRELGPGDEAAFFERIGAKRAAKRAAGGDG